MGREFWLYGCSRAECLFVERIEIFAHRPLDLAESVLRRWMREVSVAPATAFPGNGQQRAELAEIAALKKEVARLRAERDILKKAAAFFAREAT
jgi:transposase